MSWRSASKVRALTAEVVSAASASVPSGMPNRRKTYGTAPAGSIPTSWIPARIFAAMTSGPSPSAMPEVGPEDVEDREVRDGAGVGLAPPFEERHAPLGLAEQPLAKLVEQARLPDAGLAEQAHDLPVAPEGVLETAPQEADLAGASHERAAARGPRSRAPRAVAGPAAARAPPARRSPRARGRSGGRGSPPRPPRRGSRPAPRAGGACRAPSTPRACRPGRSGSRRGRSRRAPAGRRSPSGPDPAPSPPLARSAALCTAVAASAARCGASSIGSSPNAATMPVGLISSIRPPNVWIFSTRVSSPRLGLNPGSTSAGRIERAPQEREPPALPPDRQGRAGLDRGRGRPRTLAASPASSGGSVRRGAGRSGAGVRLPRRSLRSLAALRPCFTMR